MNKNIFIGVFCALATTGVFAGKTESIQCPMKNEIVATQTETERGITSMVYCAPSATDCQWKGFDARTDKKHSVAKSLQKNGRTPTLHNKIYYCEYQLDDEGKSEIRMKFEKTNP
ncbi:hypothetical protein [Candidatus Fukatsuia endosymbiont of Tuberolachnus salignus]